MTPFATLGGNLAPWAVWLLIGHKIVALDDGAVKASAGQRRGRRSCSLSGPLGGIRCCDCDTWPCPQNISQFGNSIPLPTPPNTVPVPGSADSEDCLFLNIYVPADRYDDGGEPLPVLFWNHGGSNEYGEGSTYDPTPLVTQGHIIVVTINYRLSSQPAPAARHYG